MVATAKLRRAQNRIINARPYANKIIEMISDLVSDSDLANNPFIAPREIKNICVVVVTSDRGLCGAFNANIIKEAVRYINEEVKTQNIEPMVYTVGRKSNDFFKKGNYNHIGKTTDIFSSLEYSASLKIGEELISGYLEGKFDKIIVIYNQFVSIIQQKIEVQQFLPVPVITKPDEKKHQPNYIFEPSQKQIFDHLIPKHLKAQFWRILLESNAAELGARMTAMDNATTNAQELIKSLNLTYNKERQAAITKEILEIVSGANALKAS
jgi:F-type H+-transporting ATPase subunit gamma